MQFNNPTSIKMKTKNITTLHLRKSSGRSPWQHGLFLIPLALAWFALSPTAQAVSPAPDGGYPGENTAEGDNALFSLTTNGVRNTAIGFNALSSNTGGGANTAIGASALASNTANDNTACGSFALANNTTGSGNTAIGIDALMLNIDGNGNTANGRDALFNNTSGSGNTANGDDALFNNTTGINNTANGQSALSSNTTGEGNTANGAFALQRNTTAFNNTANGQSALSSNTTGGSNTANGWGALHSNTTGGSNIALGFSAGGNLTTGNHNIDIGNVGSAGESSHIRIGTVGTQTATFIAGIHGVTVASGVGVVIDVNGHLGTVTSSARFKEAIKPMDKASEAILALKPVTFRYKHELDPDGIPQFGLVAEQVEKVNPDLVARDEQGKPYTVRYEAVNAMLLNEFLKAHRTVQELKATVAKQESMIAQQQKDFQATTAHQQRQIEALTAGLQKVSDQVEVLKAAPQLVADNQ
jgi:hypothetical protein